MRMMALSLLVCACLRAQQASVEGIAIDSVTKQPMAGVHITMRPLSDDSGMDRYGAISDRDGHFSIATLPPAEYLLIAQRNAYVQLPPEEPRRPFLTVKVNPGDRLTSLSVEMTPHALIAGRVLDEFGVPVQNVSVEAMSADTGTTRISRVTDDRGQFRLALPPGKFYVHTQENRSAEFNPFGTPEIRSDGLGPPVYGPTFYPGVATKDRATLVELAAGQEVAGIDVHLARTRSVTVSGIVTGFPENPASHAFTTIQLFSAELSQGQAPAMRFAQAAPDGTFSITGLTPGHYRLQARLDLPGADSHLQSAAVEVRPESADETGVKLALVPGEAVTGTLVIEGDPADSAPKEKLTVRLEPDRMSGMPYNGPSKGAEVGEHGAFRLEQVFPGRLRVLVLPLPANAFIKSVRLGDAEASDEWLDLSRGVSGASIQVTLSRNGGQVVGKVLGDDGEPLHGSQTYVILSASPEDFGPQNVRPVDAESKFKFTGLHPGKYRLIVLDPRQGSMDIRSGMKALFAKAPEIEIHEGDRIVKDVKVMEGPNAKP